jgi:acyl-CoA reductase-like NAD-dependent aldehyde dehydrogenase
MVAAGGDHDIDRAVKAANDAFRNSSWANLPSNDRAVFLHRLADLVDQRRDILAQLESLDVGKPLSAALAVEKAGAVEFLTKPFRDQALLDAIRQAIQRDCTKSKETG